ncbi:MAG TPA: autotransporter-associated beta strand repeat-containing protein, partial [Verrucomicrobiae bacterium]|nr:autotransporter-associated beta strand repeat-containing protein [Verrucomicrobiae bacterium]
MNPKNQTNLLRFSIAVMAVMLFGSISVQAASQTWTNAPVDATWTNVNNWVAKAVPGALNQTGNSVNNDVATFNSPIFGTIGGAADPIVPDDATILNDRSRTVGSIIFDTINCGAYVFNSTSLPNLPTALNPETGILNVCHNGSITINAAVTNSQVFLLPVEIRLPSSTAGVYHFVNNATDPSVTLFLNSVTNQSASTRGTVFTLDGSNTGTNTIESLSKGSTTSGGMGLNKVGSGRWILPNASDLAGQTVETINAGTLEVGNAGSLGSPTAATINSNGVLQVDGVTLSQTSFNLQGNGTFRMNGSATVNSVTVGNVTGSTFPKLTTTSSSDVLTVGTAANAVTGGASDSILHIGGPGTVYLGQTANYIGNWSVDAGTLQVAVVGALGSGPLINVGAGGTLDLTPFGATSWVPDTGSFGGSGTGTTVGSTAATVTAAVGGTINLNGKGITLTYTPTSFSGDTAHPALYVSQGTLSLGGNDFVINNASGTPLGIGTYVVMQQASGSISSAGSYSAIVQGSGTVPNTIGLIQVSGGNVNLVISAYTAKNLIWQGGNPNNNWDNGTTANWLDGALSSVFTVSDYVAFDATGATNPVVNLVGTLSPSGLSVDTSATNYTFTGGGRVAGATGLTKIGTGTLSLQTTNTYIGNTAISNGTIQIAANNALSSATAVSISGPGTLDLNGFSDSVASLSGSGTVDNNGAAASTLTLGNDNGSGSFAGVIQSSSNTVTVVKGGSGTQALTGSSTYAGATTIANGTLRIGNASALGSNTNVLTITGGILDLASDLNIGSLTGSGSTIANNSSATLNTLTINSPVATTYSGNIVDGTGGGAVSVKLLNGASLTFAGNSTFSGGTYVGSGSTFNIPNGPASVGGSLIASNGAVLFLSGGSSTPGTPTNVLTVDGATVTITNGAEGKIWNCQWVGGPTSTNIFDSVGSAGQ